jgi:hypothetical protein
MNDSTEFSCPYCAMVLRLKPAAEARSGPCPSCGSLVSVPAAAGAGVVDREPMVGRGQRTLLPPPRNGAANRVVAGRALVRPSPVPVPFTPPFRADSGSAGFHSEKLASVTRERRRRAWRQETVKFGVSVVAVVAAILLVREAVLNKSERSDRAPAASLPAADPAAREGRGLPDPAAVFETAPAAGSVDASMVMAPAGAH